MGSERRVAEDVLRTEAEAILALVDRLDGRFDAAVEMIHGQTGKVVVSGMGKSGLIGKKIAATLASTGTPAYFLHPAEAVHGDIGMLVDGDLALVLSHSGETSEVLRLVELVKRLSLKSIGMVGQLDSNLARVVDVALDCGVLREACPLGLAPTASTTAALAMGDALAMALAARRGFSVADFARRHPGGQLGRRLLRVADVMKVGEEVPRVAESSRMVETVAEMSRKGLGMTTVVDDQGCLRGVVTDGDLRRILGRGDSVSGLETAAVCTREPKTIEGEEAATRALALMEKWKITALVVVDGRGRVEGVVHLHDLWRLQMF